VRYTGNRGLYPIYECNWRHREALPPTHRMCLPAKPLDDAISERLLTAVTPLTIKLALAALTNLEERDKLISAQWHRRIERARYEADWQSAVMRSPTPATGSLPVHSRSAGTTLCSGCLN